MTVLPQLERELRAAHDRQANGRRVRAGRPLRGWVSIVVPAAAAAVAVAVVVVFASLGGAPRSGPAAPAPTAGMTFTATPTNPSQPLGAAIDRSLPILRQRLRTLYPGARVSRAGDTVVVQGVPAAAQATILQLTAPGELWFFDWEADVLTPDGHTVASRLHAQDATALRISQGASNGPGTAGGGGLPLYAAVRLAARQPAAPTGPAAQYFLFGAPRACAVEAAAHGRRATPGAHCLLAGPAPTPAALAAELPPGITAGEGQRLVVPRGTVVLQAAGGPGFGTPGARFYVAQGRPLLTGRDITDPRASTDASGAPDVAFRFTAAGRAAFQSITARIARRGAQMSTSGAVYDQHFAVALDDRLLTVASIDFRQYPDGIIQSAATSGADITGVLTARQARQLAAELRSGTLAATLTPQG